MSLRATLLAAAALLARRGPVPWVYHVTFYANLESIADKGLQARARSTWAQYAAHSKGKIFFTAADGVSRWAHKVHYSGAGEEGFGGLVTVLRLRADKMTDAGRDAIGTKDAMADAYTVTAGVPAALLDVWNGRKWVRLEDADLDAMADFARSRAEKDPEKSMDPLDGETEEEWEERTAYLDEDDDSAYWFDEDTFVPPEGAL